MRAAQGSTAKLLGAQLLLNSLSSAVKRSCQGGLLQFWLVSNQQQREAAKLTALYLLFQQIRKRNLRDFLASWAARAQQPEMCARRWQEEAMFLVLQDKVRARANKYSAPKDTSKAQVCRTLLHISRQWQTRLKHTAFAHFSRATLLLPRALARICAIKLKQIFAWKLTAFSRWRNCTEEQQINTRMLSLPVKIACLQHTKRIITAWREYTL